MKRVTFVTDHSFCFWRETWENTQENCQGALCDLRVFAVHSVSVHRESAKYPKRLEKARLARIVTSPFLSPEKRKRVAALWDSAHCRPFSGPITYKAVERMSATSALSCQTVTD